MARILLFCLDKVGTSMAGPAIRYWEIARELAAVHDVTLLTHTATAAALVPEGFKWLSLQDIKLRHALAGADVLITQRLTHRMAFHSKRYGVKIILDAYDPMPLENLEVYRHGAASERRFKHQSICQQFAFAFKMADGILCANQRQRDLWLGLLLALGRITIDAYDSDPTLEGLIATVPFGMSATPPVRSGVGLRERHHLKPNDLILLWGGGIWNWFDPLTLIDAVKRISLTRSDVHLCFLGIKHPNDAIPQMEMAKRAVARARDLDLLDKQVHVHYGWTGYDERQSALLDANLGVSTHFDNLETHYSFRTRLLDYLWAGLPIVATAGDTFAELIEKEDLGMVVPYKESEPLAQAILSLVDDQARSAAIRANIARIKPRYFWKNVTKPLFRMVDQLVARRVPSLSWGVCRELFSSLYQSRSPQRIVKYLCMKRP